MLYNKEAAIAAIAIMLVAAPFLGGILPAPAFAQPKQVAATTITQEANQETTVESVTFDARKLTLRTSGTVFVNLVQNGNELASESTSTSAIEGVVSFSSVTVEFDDEEITGSFDVVIEYEGTGEVIASSSSIAINESDDTDTAGEEDQAGEENSNGTTTQQKIELKNIVARESIDQESDKQMNIEAVEFNARKLTLRSSGIITVAIVQGDTVIAAEEIHSNGLEVVNFQEKTVEFDAEAVGDFEVVIMYTGTGSVIVRDISAVGDTTTAEEPNGEGNGQDPQPQTDTEPTVMLRVEAIDEDGNELTGMFITIFQGMTTVASDYTPWEVELEDGEYTVRAHDFDNESTNTHIHFVRWADKESNAEDRFRYANLTNFDEETFTAVYSTDGSTGTAGDSNSTDTNTDTGDTNTDNNNNTNSTNTDNTGNSDMTVEAGQVGVRSVLLDGTEVSGFQVQLRDASGNIIETKFTPATFDNVEPGQRIVMYSANNIYFRSWSDNGLHRYHDVDADDLGKVLTAKYESVPADQDAHLVVIAKTSDGDIIGGTTGSDTDGSLSAIPGLEVTVAPPNTMTPYTAGFTGGSEISEHFFFFNGQTYTIVIQEYPPYTFSHWEDNPSFTNRARVVDLNGDTTLVAIFNEN